MVDDIVYLNCKELIGRVFLLKTRFYKEIICLYINIYTSKTFVFCFEIRKL